MRQKHLVTSVVSVLPLLLLLSSCTGTRDANLRLRKVVLYQNGIGYFEHSGRAQEDTLAIRIRRSELDDALKTLTIVGQSKEEVTPRHATVHTMTGDDAAANKKRPDANRTVPMVVQIPDAGREELRVSYSVPTPIWKATYRVVIDTKKPEQLLLQGWAAIQNTSGHDWHKVGLTLATGAPLSFGVNLTRPSYSVRPDLENEQALPVALGAVRATSTRPSDRDGDRIFDLEDRCPDEAESYNGVDDEDGCPERGSIILSDAKITILSRVHFRSNSSELTGESHAILDACAVALLGNMEIAELEVQGHAAANESNAFVLAEDRAAVVAAYLVKQGVQRTRLRLKSYGDSLPLSTKPNAGAHAENRRIEFLILRRDEEFHFRQAQAARYAKSKAQASPAASAPATAKAAVVARQATAVPTRHVSGGMVHYRLPTNVTIANGESTLVPLVNAKVKGEEIYLFRPEDNLPGSDAHPSRAVRVVNTGDLALVPGPIAVFARDAFAGEGLLGALNPKESAFIPFALDRSALVSSKESQQVQPKSVQAIVEESMLVVDDQQRITEYTIRAGLTPPKRVYIQHQTQAGYELERPPGAEVDGARVLAPVRLGSGSQATLRLREKREGLRTLSLQHGSVEEIRSYMKAAPLPAALEAELANLLRLRVAIALGTDTLEAKRSQRFDDRIRAYEIRQNLKALAQDQGRLRANLKLELAESEERGRLLASELAVISEALTKERIELKSVLVALRYNAND